jgi:NAD(P)-dependent dehydrogenase (short-subunit alcohol dehydrogenase family)
MERLAGGCAVITGGGGLLGRGMARAFAKAGMDIVLADIDTEKLVDGVAEIESLGRRVLAVATDVSDAAELKRLAGAAFGQFGRVDLLCLNAGLAILKPFEELSRADWDKVMGVQFGGVLDGVYAFLPRLIAQPGESHIVVTASMSGVGRADLRGLNAPYVVAKFASVGLVEVMAPSLAPHGIGVSVLCPGMTVADPAAMRDGPWKMASAAWYEHNLLDADQVADEVLAGVREKRLYIFTHRAGREEVLGRHARLMEGFDQAERTSPPLG